MPFSYYDLLSLKIGCLSQTRQAWKGAAVSKYFWVLWGYLAGAGC